ncbi:hypothetical protein CC1G_02055 [Coprinopsis cinerea okayama7|uniref:BTB domain-containing protein n=1 Tax=Coprinopsis cinerea (strain Okayama-7 / 130 / ATCC MYA-4618 / FGSC 9003) TaxID=240176 RepID=A8N6F1_COPC7|nr:hypothetical protein CC1G_02055 [Coprinopsis cinerea okayama7\|eukprot:XP_001830419.2 hypothetical protein CC1G_02055 [Coprinopsis cinerea okayama7\
MQTTANSSSDALMGTPIDESNACFHPDFSDPDGDVVLASRNCKMMFRTHSYTLKTTSGFFRSMFSLPGRKCSEVIYTNEETDVLEHLLRMVCGLPVLPLDPTLVEPILHAAETYDMPGPMSIVRLGVKSSPLSDDPLRMYVICSRYGWESEMKYFSTRTLTYNLHDPTHFETLQSLSSTALLKLFALHRGRRESLRKRLNDPPFVSGGAAVCIQCQGRIEYQTWRELKYRIILEIDERPLGDTILPGLAEWPEANACWQAVCPNITCHRRLYDKAESFRVIRDCIERLPDTV